MPSAKLFAFASFFVGLFAAVPARAASSMESRSWGTVVWEDRAGACGNAAGVSNLVEQGLGTQAANDPLFVRAEVERARVGRIRASLFMRRGAAIAVRDLDAASCDELTRATSVVIAMAYELGLDPQPPSPPPPAPTQAEDLRSGSRNGRRRGARGVPSGASALGVRRSRARRVCPVTASC
jgi:hypothetical protein